MKYILALLIIVSGLCYAEDSAQKPSVIDGVYQKILNDNTKELERAFNVYNQALEVANAKVIKALEATKTDLNDTKKGNLSISERAKAIDEIDAKIAQVKTNALTSFIAEKQKKPILPP
jgi:hypothetical protein